MSVCAVGQTGWTRGRQGGVWAKLSDEVERVAKDQQGPGLQER